MQSRLNKNKKGYGYEYTDLAQINKLIEENGQSYYQFIDSVDGNDYIWTVKVDEEGKESKPIRGCKVLESGALSGNKVNPVQQYGSALTYARRYSLLMAYGLATTDDDAESLTVNQTEQKPKSQIDEDAKFAAQAFATINKVYKSPEKLKNIAEHYGKEKVTDLSVDDLRDFMSSLEGKINEKSNPPAMLGRMK